MPAILEKMVKALGWHGALSLDVILTAAGPVIIDVNPRLVEPMNACFAGVDLVSAMLDLAQSRHPAIYPAGKAGVRSHQILLAILGAAQHQGSRAAIMRECARALYRRGDYANSVEELTPVSGDPLAAVPVVIALSLTLARPSLWRLCHSGAVGAYALTPEGWEQILAAADAGR